jgi:hypothetical protein
MTAPLRGKYPYEPHPQVDDLPDIPNIPSPNKPPPPNWPLPFIPDLRGPPPVIKPTVDGYPWWVDPPGFLSPLPPPELPPFQLGPTNFGNQFQSPPTNWLQSYFEQNFAPRSGQKPDNGIGSAAQDDVSQPELPVRRLGRRTYRA